MLHLLPDDSKARDYPDGRTYPNLFDAHPPDDWQEGEVNGLQARGGFTVDMKWHHGKLRQATIRSKLGGTLRLRSYVPLKGKGLKPAKGDCPNALLSPAMVKEPLKSAELAGFELLPLRKTYEYDIETVAGNLYLCNISDD